MGTKDASLIELHSKFSEYILVKKTIINYPELLHRYGVLKMCSFGPLFSYSRPNYTSDR